MHKGYLRKSIPAKSSDKSSANRSFEIDSAYIQGLEDGVNMVKAIYECSTGQRKEIFGETEVARILDKFDFAELREIISRELG